MKTTIYIVMLSILAIVTYAQNSYRTTPRPTTPPPKTPEYNVVPRSGCLLGKTQILMANYSSKSIEALRPGEIILDGNLQPVKVVHILSNFLGHHQPLYQFLPDGPIFTIEHQFLSNLELGHVGVVSKEELFLQDPTLMESKVHSLEGMKTLLQFQDGLVRHASFDVAPYKTMLEPSTRIYACITSAVHDGSYIANNFVSRDVLPNFELWPLTYATLGHILVSCEMDAIETYEASEKLTEKTIKLMENWSAAISDIDHLEAIDIKFDPLSWIQLGVQEILQGDKMSFAQRLNTNGASILRQVLENHDIPFGKRHALMKKIFDLTSQSFECNFKDF